jgi:hypothetical protein
LLKAKLSEFLESILLDVLRHSPVGLLVKADLRKRQSVGKWSRQNNGKLGVWECSRGNNVSSCSICVEF